MSKNNKNDKNFCQFRRFRRSCHFQNGQILIIAFIFMLVVLILVNGMLAFVMQNVRATRFALAREQALQLAEAAIDNAVKELNDTTGSYTGETGTVLGTGVFDVSVVNISGGIRQVTATGYVPDKVDPEAIRRIRVEVSINTTEVSFNYGVQVGDGGLQMSNNVQVTGNVYSNGPITGSNTPLITGDAISASATGLIDGVQVDGNAKAHTITNSTVGGNAHGTILSDSTVGGNVFENSISNCTVGGNAWYTSNSGCTIGGTINTPYGGDPDPEPQQFPIPDSQINDWKSQAESGGVISGGLSLSGTQQMTLGPKKIEGNLTMSNTSKITLTGPLWITGSVSLTNSSIIALDSSYGNLSEVIVSDGNISTSNSVQFQGAGADSYILMVALPTGGAFSINNSADAMIAYAPNGEANISNNVQIKEVTAYRLNINNSAEVIYETGLASVEFSSGPGGSWQVVSGSWREIK